MDLATCLRDNHVEFKVTKQSVQRNSRQCRRYLGHYFGLKELAVTDFRLMKQLCDAEMEAVNAGVFESVSYPAFQSPLLFDKEENISAIGFYKSVAFDNKPRIERVRELLGVLDALLAAARDKPDMLLGQCFY